MSIPAWEPIAAPLARGVLPSEVEASPKVGDPSTALGMTRTVIRCDFRGQFQSLTDTPPATLEEHARDLVALLDHLGIPRVHVAGTSFGGFVGMVLAAIAPERVERLTVITAAEKTNEAQRASARFGHDYALQVAAGQADGTLLFRNVLESSFSEKWLRTRPADEIERRSSRAPLLPPAFYLGAAAIIGVLRDLDLTGLLPKIQAPTLVIAADQDRVFPVPHSEAIAEMVPDARLVVLEQCGHAAVVEQPERIVELLRAS